MAISRVVLEPDKVELLAADIGHVIQALPQLERLARVELRAVSPAASAAVKRMTALRDKLTKGV